MDNWTLSEQSPLELFILLLLLLLLPLPLPLPYLLLPYSTPCSPFILILIFSIYRSSLSPCHAGACTPPAVFGKEISRIRLVCPLTQAHTPKQKSRNCMSHKSPTLSQLPTSLPTAQAPISGPSMLGRRPCLAYSSLSVPVCTEIRRVARVFRRGAARTRNTPLSLAGSRAYPAKKTAPSTRNINTPSSPPRWQISSTSQLSTLFSHPVSFAFFHHGARNSCTRLGHVESQTQKRCPCAK